MTLKTGNKYLPVKWRLVWLQREHPTGVGVNTDLVHFAEDFAVFQATITITDADGALLKKATGWGKEYRDAFRDFIEKAETKAIGRALACLGFGTEFCDLDDLEEDAEVPGETPAQRTLRQHRDQPNATPPRSKESAHSPRSISEAQHRAIVSLGNDCGFGAEDLNRRAIEEFGKATLSEITRSEASQMIDALKKRSTAMRAQP
jgi:hypothetical protein